MIVAAYATLLAWLLLGGPPADEFDPWTQESRYELEYRVDLAGIAGEDDRRVRVWLPTPAENACQDVLSRRVESPWPHRETRDARGNRFFYLEPELSGSQPATIVMHFEVVRHPSRGLRAAAAQKSRIHDPKRFLGAQRRIPLDGAIRDLAVEQANGSDSDTEKIRAYYGYVVASMDYSKRGEGWGNGDAIWACNAKYGNCTDFHSLLIGMSRSQGIAARFMMGFPIPPDKESGSVPGYHCWAELYDPSRGWIPVDASEAKKSGKVEAYFGLLPSDRVEFTVGRDLVLSPAQAGPPLNYFIYPYVEMDGRPVNGVSWTLHFRRLSGRDPKADLAPE